MRQDEDGEGPTLQTFGWGSQLHAVRLLGGECWIMSLVWLPCLLASQVSRSKASLLSQLQDKACSCSLLWCLAGGWGGPGTMEPSTANLPPLIPFHRLPTLCIAQTLVLPHPCPQSLSHYARKEADSGLLNHLSSEGIYRVLLSHLLQGPGCCPLSPRRVRGVRAW